MTKKKKEYQLWDKVKFSLEKNYGYICSNNHSKRKKLQQRGFINIGLGGIIPDVIGIRNIGNRFEPRIEIIAVEVKENLPNYRRRHMDQVRRAAVFAHKVFLAAPREFSAEEVELAVDERIGLFEINPIKRRLKLIVPSPLCEPSESKIIELMSRLEFFKCSVCNCYWNKNLINITRYRPRHVFSQKQSIEFVGFICEKCASKLYGLHATELRNKFAEEWKFKKLNRRLEILKSKIKKLAGKQDILRVNRRVAKQREKVKKMNTDIRKSSNRKLKQVNKKLDKMRKRLRSA